MTKKDTKKEETKEHIEQLVIGVIRFGDAGIDRKSKEKGYICHVCTIDENSRFVDLALKKEHLEQIRDGATKILEVLKEKR